MMVKEGGPTPAQRVIYLWQKLLGLPGHPGFRDEAKKSQPREEHQQSHLNGTPCPECGSRI